MRPWDAPRPWGSSGTLPVHHQTRRWVMSPQPARSWYEEGRKEVTPHIRSVHTPPLFGKIVRPRIRARRLAPSNVLLFSYFSDIPTPPNLHIMGGGGLEQGGGWAALPGAQRLSVEAPSRRVVGALRSVVLVRGAYTEQASDGCGMLGAFDDSLCVLASQGPLSGAPPSRAPPAASRVRPKRPQERDVERGGPAAQRRRGRRAACWAETACVRGLRCSRRSWRGGWGRGGRPQPGAGTPASLGGGVGRQRVLTRLTRWPASKKGCLLLPHYACHV
jgi:hypothetical protein